MANKMAEKKRNTSRSQMAEAKVSGREKEQPAKSAKTAPKTGSRERSRAARREQRGNSTWSRFRNTRLGGFFVDSYYELRHKVTWPTFEQARNLTIAVIVISAAVGLFLWLIDLGLYQLFLLINGK
ncbi:preprotein translocase subunit SecE [Ktedonospora formicarum]|uniref:Protein translocase subunit SecE n=1 Tax=Ktedonospora formicarum TaxID=2778364 RepID=A0A8J3I2C1_9CHLR|nr:preprotein translocase subunit SecE [Ktedonospora formicarum]GHO44194.1 hypothetical protein KSX_23570 [Ktedonospora formicarum]